MKPLYTSNRMPESSATHSFRANYKLFLIVMAICFAPAGVYSQMVGPSCYASGTYVEIGIDGAGGFEGVDIIASPNPASYHFRSGNNIFGFVSNPQLNAWATFDGDFFTPGTPENGWGIEIIDGATNLTASNNCATPLDIPGSITSYTVNGLCRIITWEGDYINGSYNLHIKLDYVLLTTDLYYTTVVTITNNGINIPDFYYYRNVDPDNNQSISGDFTTQNTIMSQPGAGCNKAHVRATSDLPAGQPQSYFGFAGVGADFRVIYGGFSNRDGSDIWNATGFTGTTGSTNFADEAIAIAYRIQNLAPATTQTFRFVNILDDLAANNAINNLFSFTWPGAPAGTSTQCNPVTDTVTICNGNSTTLSVIGSALADFTWSWSPTAGLTPTTGTTVTANPIVNTLYTVTGTPINPCFTPISQQIYVKVIAGGAANANAGPDQTISCTTPTTVLAGSTTTGGATYGWVGPGIVSGGTTLTPTVNAIGSYILTVSVAGGCSASDTIIVTATSFPPNASAGLDQILTCTITSLNLSGSSTTGGTTFSWAGPGITAGGTTTTPTVNAVGTYTITVTETSSGCTNTDIVVVTINNTPPNANAGIDQMLPCGVASVVLAGSSSTAGVSYSWAGPGIVSGGTTTTPTVNLSGTYTITVTDPTNGCTATDQANVILVGLIPNANAGLDQFLNCIITSVNLAGSSTTAGVNFAWAGLGITAGGTTPTPTVNAPGTYTITVTDPANSCTNTDVVDVTQNIIQPIADFMYTPIKITESDPLVTFVNTSSAANSYQWNFGDGSNSALDNPSHLYADTGTFCILLVASATSGCIDSISHCLYIEPDYTVFIPNSFTPNADGLNEYFKVYGRGIKSFEVRIFDRWGEEIYYFNDIKGWNGSRQNGKICKQDVYVYRILVTFGNGDSHQYLGNINLIR